MEITGKITVTKTKKGYQILFVYEKNGKEKKETVSCFKVDNDRYNGKDCVVTKDKGVIVRFVVKLDEKEEVLYSKKSLQCSSETNDEIMLDSYDIKKSFLPSETKAVMDGVRSIDNFALKLNKVTRYDERDKEGQKDEKFYFFKNKKGKPKKNIPDDKYQIKFPDAYNNFPFKNLADHHRFTIEALNLSVSSCEGTIDWRLIVGLGNESVYDTSMTLHHVYGIPYIPASAVKGVVRSWVITEAFNQDEEKAILDKGFCDVFGCPKKIKDTPSYYEEERKGKVWFFDALPLSKPEIEVDIMNPHYGDYYAEKKVNGNSVPPVDYLKPNPIPFLTVGEKDEDNHPLKFQFIVGVKDKDNKSIGKESRLFVDSEGKNIQVRKENGGVVELVDASSDTNLLKITEAWMKKALEEHGIGAKTAVGYGYMTNVYFRGAS